MFSESNFPIVQSLPNKTGSQKFKMAADTRISAYIHDSNNIPTAMPCFRDQETRRNKWEYCLMSGYVVNQRWRSLIGSILEITHISAGIQDSNKNPMTIPMFSESGNPEKQVGILSYVWMCRKSKMAAIYRK